ncbi:MAG: AAA family ATPase [Gemmataceae bacterium]|nr:AAA family ATPase [Gemmataceae bacterium]MCI0739426.1 AAA family ATPase [Gemmataceae bacterium]
MSTKLTELKVGNYRCLADVTLRLDDVNVFFGPNGSGKSTILDTIWFFRDCAIRGVETASAARSHGIGLLWDGAADADQITVSLSTQAIAYELRFGISSGRIEPFVGERLRSSQRGPLIDRTLGADRASLFNEMAGSLIPVPLREPEKLSIGVYLDFNKNPDPEANDLDRLLHFVRLYHSRSFFMFQLKQQGSEMSYETRVWDRGNNLWSVLRNLHDRKAIDNRFVTIMKYMAESFPSFDGIRLEQTGPTTVYAHFHEKGRRKEIYASGVSDGHLQQLLLLTALFAEDRPAVLLFDEPEVSLHPWPLAVFAKAVQEATQSWNKQVLIATHSPVLLSQFAPDEILATEVADGRTHLRRLSDIVEIKDLLEQYPTGSLYMAEVVGGQKQEAVSSVGN